MRRYLDALADLIYPPHCLACKKRVDRNTALCQDCWASIKRQRPPFCKKCGREMFSFDENAELLCSDCRKTEYSFERAFCACRYEEPLKGCIHLFKYKGRLSLAEPLSRLLIDFARENAELRSTNLVVPMPLHPVRARERQFNQAEILARPLAQAFGIELNVNGVRRKKCGLPHSKLKRDLRFENISGAFEITEPATFRGRDVLLVDDVFTTGATADACAKVVCEANANRVTILTLARSSQ